MRIYTGNPGVAVNHLVSINKGSNVIKKAGHFYEVLVGPKVVEVIFQHGPIHEEGVNGLTNEALLAILIHRTECINDQVACEKNTKAIELMKETKELFEQRIAERQARGVSGQNIV
jgi:hypothetical protein